MKYGHAIKADVAQSERNVAGLYAPIKFGGFNIDQVIFIATGK